MSRLDSCLQRIKTMGMRIDIERGNTKDGKLIRYKYDVSVSYNIVATGEVLTPKKTLGWRDILRLIAESDPAKEDKFKPRHM